MPGWGDPVAAEARAIGATCGGVRVWSLYVPNGRKVDDPHYVYKLDWLARLREAAHGWLGEDVALVGDWNIAPRDEDVFDMAAYANGHPRHPARAGGVPGLPRRRVRRRRPPARAGAGGLHLLGLLPAALRAQPRHAHRLRPRLAVASPPGSSHAFIDRDERAGQGASDHAPVVVDLD